MKTNIFRILFLSALAYGHNSAHAQNVGIGTSNPQQKLHVEGSTYVKDSLAIGTTVPKANLHVAGLNGVVFTGGYGSGSMPGVSGTGARLLWYPGKAAFRAGYASGTLWDDASIGNFSTATGQSTTASGNSSTAMGYGSIASGMVSTAVGRSTKATGDYSTAMGENTTASNTYSTAMGYGTTASGNSSTAMGKYTTASGPASTAMGEWTTAEGYFSTAMGNITTASGFYSTAMGKSTTASGNNTTAMGSNVSTNGQNGAFIVGDANSTVTNSSAANQATMRFAGGYRFFSDAAANVATGVFISGTSGYVGIGTSAPAAKLAVDGTFALGTNGTTLNNMFKQTGSVAAQSLAAGASFVQTFSVANAATTATVYVSPGAALPDGIIIAYSRVSATGTVEVKFRNTLAAAASLPTMSVYITVIQ